VATENPVCGRTSVHPWGPSPLKGLNDSEGECLQWTSDALGTRVDEQVAVGPGLRLTRLRRRPLVSMVQAANLRQLNDSAEFGSLLRPGHRSIARE
jgi:hypothetical protein